MSSGRICFGCGRGAFLAINPPRGREILAGDEFDAPLQARRRFAVARVLRALELNAEPREQRPPPALARGDINRSRDPLRRDRAGAQLDAKGDEARERLVGRRAWRASLQVLSVGKLFGSRAVAQRLEAAAR